jgi:hypothetical protein
MRHIVLPFGRRNLRSLSTSPEAQILDILPAAGLSDVAFSPGTWKMLAVRFWNAPALAACEAAV